MNKIKTIIVDDEQLAREIVKTYLSKRNEYELLAEASNGFEGIKLITELKPELVFLDIQMPKLNGFEMLELIEKPPNIIFTTAYDQYAIKAFEIHAVDYLLKPFSEERFFESLDRAYKFIASNSRQKNDYSKILNSKISSEEFLHRLVVKFGSKISLINVSDIIYIEAQDDYTMIYTSQGNFLKQKTMKFFEENLNPKDFLRIHRSYIIKIDLIKELEVYEKESYRVTLTNGKKLPVSKSGYVKVKELLNRS